ncbi:MAG: germination protein YpeB, partial [Clostridia bacterium]|nr:germination protein YpeB [Clostridia bacterium]
MDDKNFTFGETENTDNTKEIKRQEKEHKRAERYKAKAAAKREKARLRAEQREQRENIKRERKRLKEERKSQSANTARGRGGWLAAVISLGLSTLILASVLAYVTLAPANSDNRLETAYRKSFYDTVAQVNNMDLDLSKALATSDSGAIQTYLVDVAVNSELAENNLQQLPIKDENKFYTTKIVNQVGDYAKYLNKKLIRGEKLSSTDRENLKNLYKANLALKDALQAAMEGMNDDFNFADMGDMGGNALLDNFNELQELSLEYPELIYDGPFSDGRDNREIKGLSGRKITEAEATDIFGAVF